MSITGNIKFFNPNEINNDSTFAFTSANVSNANFIFDNNIRTKLSSNGSNDTIPEVWTITFDSSVDLTGIQLARHNLKDFNIQFFNGTIFVDFSPAITFTTNTIGSQFFDFTKVNTNQIKLVANKTITPDVEKQVGEFRALSEIGTVEKNAIKANPEFRESSKVHETSNKGNVYVFFGEKFRVRLNFDNSTDNDLILFRTLKDRGQPFFVYLSGGQIGFIEEGFRIEDMFFVNYINPFRYELVNNLHDIGVKITLDLRET